MKCQRCEVLEEALREIVEIRSEFSYSAAVGIARAALAGPQEESKSKRRLGSFSYIGYEEELQADYSPKLTGEPTTRAQEPCGECGATHSGPPYELVVTPGGLEPCPSCRGDKVSG